MPVPLTVVPSLAVELQSCLPAMRTVKRERRNTRGEISRDVSERGTPALKGTAIEVSGSSK